jgi:hypothetical protein
VRRVRLLLPLPPIRARTAVRCTGPEPKIWAASPVENTPWGPSQAVSSGPSPGGPAMGWKGKGARKGADRTSPRGLACAAPSHVTCALRLFQRPLAGAGVGSRALTGAAAFKPVPCARPRARSSFALLACVLALGVHLPPFLTLVRSHSTLAPPR